MTDHLAQTAITAWSSFLVDATLEPMPRVTNPLWRAVAANGQEFVLKRLPEYPPGAKPVDEFRVLTHLQASGIPVALPVLTDEATIHTTVDQRLYSLLPWIPRDHGNHDLEPEAASTAYAVGQAIGRMDSALAACPWSPESFSDKPVEILTKGLSDLPEEATRPVMPIIDLLRDTCSNLPAQLTHGDCNDGNVLVHRQQVSGFLDFDHLPTGPRVRDLSYYLVSRVRSHLEQPEGSEEAAFAMLEVFDRYVAGYHDTYALTDHELAAVVPLMLLIELGMARWSLFGWEPDQEHYRSSLRTIKWITANLIDHATAVPSSSTS